MYESSLKYCHAQSLSLKYPHWLWLTAGENTYEVSKARIQLLFLSSQYPCGKLTRHWSADNPSGYCQYPFCYDEGLVETPEHILLHCPAYVKTRQSLLPLFLKIQHPISHSLALSLLTSGPTTFLQFLMDCSSLPEVISSYQNYGDQIYRDLFYLSRTWCFVMHKERMKQLGRWNLH